MGLRQMLPTHTKSTLSVIPSDMTLALYSIPSLGAASLPSWGRFRFLRKRRRARCALHLRPPLVITIPGAKCLVEVTKQHAVS